MSWEIKIAKKALKELKRIPKKDATRLSFVLRELLDDPYQGDIEKIKGESTAYRRRSGSYRIIYDILPKQKYIEVSDVSRRTTTTYKK